MSSKRTGKAAEWPFPTNFDEHVWQNLLTGWIGRQGLQTVIASLAYSKIHRDIRGGRLAVCICPVKEPVAGVTRPCRDGHKHNEIGGNRLSKANRDYLFPRQRPRIETLERISLLRRKVERLIGALPELNLGCGAGKCQQTRHLLPLARREAIYEACFKVRRTAEPETSSGAVR